MVQITFSFGTVEEALAFLRGKVAVTYNLSRIATPPSSDIVAVPEESLVSVAMETGTPKKRRGRPPKVKAEAPTVLNDAPTPESIKAQPKQPNAPVQAIAETVPTLESVRVALREVFNTKGAQAATALLKQFDVTRVSEVKPERYAAFIKACAGA